MHRRKLLLHALKFLDLLLLAACFAFSALAASSGLTPGSFRELLALRVRLSDFIFFLGYMTFWHAVLSSFDLYSSRRMFSAGRETIAVLKATSSGTVFLLAVAFIFDIRPVTPLFLAFFFGTATLAVAASHAVFRHGLEHLWARRQRTRNIVVVGSNSRALAFAKTIESRPEMGYRIKGFADNTPVNAEVGTAQYPLVSDLQGLREFLRSNAVDEVVIALPVKSFYAKAAGIAAACREQGLAVRFLSDLFNADTGRTGAGHIDPRTIAAMYAGDQNRPSLLIKRATDVIASLILLLVLSPFFLAVAGAIKMTSPGPVFFVQKRLGFNKRLFNLYKFRTMVPDAEARIHEIEHLNEAEGPVFKIRNDPRVTTAVGRILRKTSIDELPQLMNVLKGDMSLVGPRPMSVRDYERFEKDWHYRRFSILPGMTCLWQCSGRSDVSFEEWMRLDMKYIENWSLLLDFKILLHTIPAVLKGSGAA